MHAAFALFLHDNPLLLRVLNQVPSAQQRATNLFAAVHYLLLTRSPEHPLAQYYYGSPEHPLAQHYRGGKHHALPFDENAVRLFAQFLLENEDQVKRVLCSKVVQTNEIGRAGVIVLGVAEAARRSGAKGVHLLEVGASAGLTMMLDAFRYRHGDVETDGGDGIRIAPEMIGALRPDYDGTLPELSVSGIDPYPIDLSDPEARTWLRACIFGEDGERLALFDRAVEVARARKPVIQQGDANETIFGEITRLPQDRPVVVLTSFMLMYYNPEQLAVFEERLKKAAEHRGGSIWWLAFDYERFLPSEVGAALSEREKRRPPLMLAKVTAENVVWHHLANAELYGESIRWLAGEHADGRH